MDIRAPGMHVFRFGVFELDARSGELRRHGLKVRFPDQSFQILKVLLSRPGEVVTRDELRQTLWTSDTFVDFEVGLNSAVRKLRAALDDAAENPKFVETIPRRGYRFVAPVMVPPSAPPLLPGALSGPPPNGDATDTVADAVPLHETQTMRVLRAPPRRWAAAGAAVVALLLIGAAGWYKLGRMAETRVSPPSGTARVEGPGGGAVAPLVLTAGQPHAASRLGTRAIKPDAFDAYTKGLSAKGLERAHAFHRAIAYFEEAIAIQPDFAEAYAELALTQVQFLYTEPYAPHQVVPKAETAARKALELDDTLHQAHRALGRILNLYYWRWDEGDKMLARASTQAGGEPLEAVSTSLIRRGQFEEALAVAERARKLDPLSVNAQVAVGTAYRAAGQYDRAITELRRALAMSPGRDRINFQIGVTLLAMGRLDEAIREIEIGARPASGHNSRHEAYLGYAYAAAGRTQEARAMLQELELHRRDQYVSWFGVALIHDGLGNRAPALAAIQRAFEDHAVEFGMMHQYPPFKTIASEPAFRSIMRTVGR